MPTYNVGQTVKLIHGDTWSTGYVESASCGVYGVRVAGERLYHVTAVSLRQLELRQGRLEEVPTGYLVCNCELCNPADFPLPTSKG